MSRRERVSNPDWVRTEDGVARCNQILRSFRLPEFDSDFVFKTWYNNCDESFTEALLCG